MNAILQSAQVKSQSDLSYLMSVSGGMVKSREAARSGSVSGPDSSLVQLGASCLSSLCLGFLISEMGIIVCLME